MKHLHSVRFLIFGLTFLLLGTAVSCNTTEETAESTADESAAEIEVPEEVVVVLEAALRNRSETQRKIKSKAREGRKE